MLLNRIVDLIAGPPPIEVWIETGTLHGESVANVAPAFREVHTIELSKLLYEAACDRFAGTNVACHYGDSGYLLPLILGGLSEPVIVYLDAHYCTDSHLTEGGEFPLWRELEAVRAYPHRVICIVDDMHTWGLERPDLRKHETSDRHWEHVSEKTVLSALGSRVATHYTVDNEEFVAVLK